MNCQKLIEEKEDLVALVNRLQEEGREFIKTHNSLHYNPEYGDGILYAVNLIKNKMKIDDAE